MCCYCRDGACPVRVPEPPSVSLNPRPCPSTPVHITLSRPGPYARLRPLSSSSSHVPVLVPCPNTFQRRRCASQTKPMQECHPERELWISRRTEILRGVYPERSE